MIGRLSIVDNCRSMSDRGHDAIERVMGSNLCLLFRRLAGRLDAIGLAWLFGRALSAIVAQVLIVHIKGLLDLGT